MRKDDHIIFENYLSKKSEDTETSPDDIMASIEAKRAGRKNIGAVRGEDAEAHSVEGEIEKLLNYLRQDYTEGRGLDNETLGDVIHEIEDILRSVSPSGGNEDAEEYSDELFGSKSDWGDSYEQLKEAISNCLKDGLDASQLSDILRDAESYGYTGDPLPDNFLQPFNPSSTKCYKDLEFAVKEFYEKGLQDS